MDAPTLTPEQIKAFIDDAAAAAADPAEAGAVIKALAFHLGRARLWMTVLTATLDADPEETMFRMSVGGGARDGEELATISLASAFTDLDGILGPNPAAYMLEDDSVDEVQVTYEDDSVATFKREDASDA